VDCTDSLKAKFPLLESTLQNPLVRLFNLHLLSARSKTNSLQDFKELYRYAYQFAKSALETPGQKSVDKQTAKDMLNVLLRSRWPLLPVFLSFLDVSYRCLHAWLRVDANRCAEQSCQGHQS
jgi:hypothetical protein